MRRFWLSFVFSVFSLVTLWAAVPQNFSFQAVVRDAAGNLVSDSPVGVRVPILRNDSVAVYTERRTASTNANGLISFAIGDGKALSNQSLGDVDWSNGSFFLKSEFDLFGNGDYSISQTTPLNKYDSLVSAHKDLTARVDAIEALIRSLHGISSDTFTYKRTLSPVYTQFSTSSFNFGPRLYYALQSGDRIIYIVRHSNRDQYSTGNTGTLNDKGIVNVQTVGAYYKGGLAADNDVYFGSTSYVRTRQTCYYMSVGRGYGELADYTEAHNPIDVIDASYYTSETNWDNVAAFYDANVNFCKTKSLAMINELCRLTDGKTLSWFTSHDGLITILTQWASGNTMNFKNPNWINYMSGVAVIVHKDKTWEVYPVRHLSNGFLTYGDWTDSIAVGE